MKFPFRSLLLAVSLAVTSCSHYSTDKEKQPAYRSSTPAGQSASQALKDRDAQIGRAHV